MDKSRIPPAGLSIAMVRGGQYPGMRSFAERFGFGNDEARVSTGRFAWNMIARMGAVVR